MRANFFGPDPAYHEARRRFVFKGAPPTKLGVGPAASADREQAAGVGLDPNLQRLGERGRGECSLGPAWTDLLQVTIRRLFAPAP